MKKSFGLITLGAILEYYDFAIYIYFAKAIGESLIPIHDPQANLIATFGVLALGALFRPLGGIFIAHFGDSRGRKNVFIYTILLMAIPTALIAFIPSYSQIGIMATLLLVVLRCIQGLAIGGEIPGSIVFAYELSKKANKALNTNIVVAGTNLGFFMASSIGAWLLSLSISNHLAWRLAFVIGGVFGIISYFLRKNLSETPEFANYRNFINTRPQLPALELLKKHVKPLLQMVSYGGFAAASLAVYSFFMPSYLSQYFSFPMAEILKYNSYSLLIFIASAFMAGKYHTWFNKAFLIISLLIFNLVNFILFTHYQELSLKLIVLIHYFIWFYIGITCGRLPVLAASFFPVQVRYSGVALSYNIALGIIAGFTQVILFSWIKASGVLWLPALYIGILSIPALIFLMTIPAQRLVDYN